MQRRNNYGGMSGQKEGWRIGRRGPKLWGCERSEYDKENTESYLYLSII
jgi:hypothetical protein